MNSKVGSQWTSDPFTTRTVTAPSQRSHHLTHAMLKRQRPLSPSPLSPETSLEDVHSDVYQPDSKRRKYFGPSRSSETRPRGCDEPTAYDSENEVDDGREEYFVGRREWQTAAGVYKDANILLHDLHAQHRHRMLFNTPTLVPQNDSCCESSHFSTTLSGPARSKTPLFQHQGFVIPAPNVPAQELDQSGSIEAQRISHRYEDTNRCVLI